MEELQKARDDVYKYEEALGIETIRKNKIYVSPYIGISKYANGTPYLEPF